MANCEQPGPYDQASRPFTVQDGTLCRMPSPECGPIGFSPADVFFGAEPIPECVPEPPPICPITPTPVPTLSLAEVKKAVLDAVAQKRITDGAGNPFSQLTAVINSPTGYLFQTDKEGVKHPVYLADDMYYVLNALSNSFVIRIMSMMRLGDGYHGWTEGRPDGSALCSAMDILEYGDLRFNLINGVGTDGGTVDSTIGGVVRLLDNLPKGLYGFGLTRPSPKPLGPPMNGPPGSAAAKNNKDVFLPCWSLDKHDPWAMYTWGKPLENPTPQFVNEKAKKDVNDAIIRNSLCRGVKVAQMFMDGPDHLHLHVWSAK